MQIFYLIFLASLIANFNVENAFPNLSFEDPVGIHAPNDGTNRLFVIEQEGRIKVFNNDTNTSDWDMFLDITNLVDQDGGYTEEGLLGLAFHPDFTDNGYFYVNYTEHNPRRNVIARYTVNSNNPNQANYNSSQIILEVLGNLWSPVIVPTIIISISRGEIPLLLHISLTTSLPMSERVSPPSTILLSLIPVLETIHSSLVSTICSKSLFDNTFSGTTP